MLAGEVFGGWSFGGVLALITIFSEGALLLVAAQTGFVDGPRVMANMAVDYWFPHRFASLSSRLTMQNGVLLMGGSAILLLLYSRGRISTLVVMYSINVFLTFSLSELGMSRFFIKNRRKEPHWKKHLPVHLTGLTVCLTILIVTTLEKFTHGGWLTLVITSVVIILCYLIKGHYNRVRKGVRELDDMLVAIPHKGEYNTDPADPKEMTAIQLVSGYNGFGVHTFLSIIRGFPGLYKNFVFVSVSEVDAGAFKESEAVGLPGRGDQGVPQEIRRPGPPARLPGRVAPRHGHRRRRNGLGPLRNPSPANSPNPPSSPGRRSSAGPGSSTASSTTKPPSPSSRSCAGRGSRRSSCPSASTFDPLRGSSIGFAKDIASSPGSPGTSPGGSPSSAGPSATLVGRTTDSCGSQGR